MTDPRSYPQTVAATDTVAADRSLLQRAQRVVVKIGSSSLTRPDGRLNIPALRKLVDVLAQVWERGTQVVLVTSGGISAGFMPHRRHRLLANQRSWRTTPMRLRPMTSLWGRFS